MKRGKDRSMPPPAAGRGRGRGGVGGGVGGGVANMRRSTLATDKPAAVDVRTPESKVGKNLT